MNKKACLQEKKNLLPTAYCLLRLGRGFALIESFIAIAILLSAISAVMAVSSKSLQLSGFTRNKITAFYLAQEPVEFIHNIRDQNRLEDRSAPAWLFGLAVCNPGPCIIDVTNRAAVSCGIGPCPPLRRGAGAGGRYGYDGSWNPTLFTRTVGIEEIAPGREAKITVQMTWREGSGVKTLIIENSLFAWAFP